MPLAEPTAVSAAVHAGDMCGAVCVGQATQGAAPRLMPPSALVKVVLRKKLAVEMPGPRAPLLLVLHGKQDRTQCLSLLLGKKLLVLLEKKSFFPILYGASFFKYVWVTHI